GLAPADVGLRLVIGDQELDRPTVDAAALVDAVDRHLDADQRGLAARGRRARQGLERPDLEGLGLTERLPPRSRRQHSRPQVARRPGGQTEEAPPRRLAAPPHVARPGLVLPAFRHRHILPARVSECRPKSRPVQLASLHSTPVGWRKPRVTNDAAPPLRYEHRSQSHFRRSSIFLAFGGIVPAATTRIAPRSFITSRMASTMLPLTCSALAPGASSTWNSSSSW